jgi:HlyD family secretion protein
MYNEASHPAGSNNRYAERFNHELKMLQKQYDQRVDELRKNVRERKHFVIAQEIVKFEAQLASLQDQRKGAPESGTRSISPPAGLVLEQKPKEPPLQFGPVIERVVRLLNAPGEGKGDMGEGKGGDGLDLAGGKLVDLPKEFGKWSAQQRNKWSTENNVDLVVDFVEVTQPLSGEEMGAAALVPHHGLNLAIVSDGRWENATGEELRSALNSPIRGSADEEELRHSAFSEQMRMALNSVAPESADRKGMPGSPTAIVQVVERRGIVYYAISSNVLPATFAFQTRKGDLGLLQVIRYVEEPVGVRVRYKLAQSSGAKPAAPGQEAGQAEKLPAFRTATVTRGDVAAIVRATGTLEPEDVVDVGAQVAGQIVKLGDDPHNKGKPIDWGSQVEQGTVLAQIDPMRYKSRFDQEAASLRRAKAELTLARAKALSETGDTAKASLAAAEAAIAQGEAALERARTDLDCTLIRSPCKGTIIARRVNVGQNVGPNPNTPGLFLIAKDLGEMQVWAMVNEADIGRIRKGMDASFTVDAFSREVFKGKVLQVRLDATMTQNVVWYTVVVAVDNPDLKLMPYMTANVRFETDHHHDVLLVPAAAIRWWSRPEEISPDSPPLLRRVGQHECPVWVKDPDGRHVRPVVVHVGISDGSMTEISGPNVKEGMEVIVSEER